MCFPNEIDDYEGIEGVMPSNDYVKEVLKMIISQPKPDSALSDFCVLALRDDEDAPPAPTDDAIADDVIIDIASLDILGYVVGESDSLGPPLSFDILSRFVSCSNDILAFSSMDLSIFEHFLPLLLMILMRVHLIHPQHRFMIFIMSLCNLILMKITGLTPIIAFVAPLFGPTRLGGPNRIRDALIPINCSTPFRSNPIGESEPDLGCSDTTKCNTHFFFFKSVAT